MQHHHAHLAACLAEHGESGPAVGAIFDGTGYGADGTVWGGELLVGDLRGFERAGHLLAGARCPAASGGPGAVADGVRVARRGARRRPAAPAGARGAVDAARWDAVARLRATGVASPLDDERGRLFDAVAALCGLRDAVSYEGQAAIELEAARRPRRAGRLSRCRVATAAGVARRARDRPRGRRATSAAASPPAIVAARFHNALARATADACAAAAARDGTRHGRAVRRRLPEPAAARARPPARSTARACACSSRERLPPNDGGISYGQAAVAASLS